MPVRGLPAVGWTVEEVGGSAEELAKQNGYCQPQHWLHSDEYKGQELYCAVLADGVMPANAAAYSLELDAAAVRASLIPLPEEVRGGEAAVLARLPLLQVLNYGIMCGHASSAAEQQALAGRRVTLVANGRMVLSDAEYRPAPTGFASSAELRRLPAKHTLCSCLLMWNRARFVMEWMRFHTQHHGLGKTFIIDNESDDELPEVVRWLQLYFEVEVIPFAMGPNSQNSAMIYCQMRAERECGWTLHTDVDEFLVPTRGVQPPLAQHLADPGLAEDMGAAVLVMHSFYPPYKTIFKRSPLSGVVMSYPCFILDRPPNQKFLLRRGGASLTRYHIVHRTCLAPGLRDVFVSGRYRLVHFRFQSWEIEMLRYRRRSSGMNLVYRFIDENFAGDAAAKLDVDTPSETFLNITRQCNSSTLHDYHAQHFHLCRASFKVCPATEFDPTLRGSAGGPAASDTRQLLITGVGSLEPGVFRGQHPIQRWLHALRDDERQVARTMLSVNWRLAVRPPAVHLARRYRHIVHVLVPPLAALAVLRTYDDETWVGIAKSTATAPGSAGFQPIAQRLLSLPPLVRAMAHWLMWTEIVDWVADERILLQDINMNSLCAKYGVDIEVVADPSPDREAGGQGTAPTAPSWSDLDRADPALARLVRIRAQRYGFEVAGGDEQ